jgi:tetratricopeptide (TPR) repeat protein
MADPKRLESHGSSEAADRDSRTEALLVEGLDRYFTGRYEEAIHIWTRVLFVDRTHARARAYIDRARTTLAERQRQSEEMLQASHDLLEQGQTEAARHLLTEAVATSGDDEKAAALRVKLERRERLERLDTTPRRRATDRQLSDGPVDALSEWPSSRNSRSALFLVAVLALALALVALGTNPTVTDWLGIGSANEQLAAVSTESKWPTALSSDEVALARARNLYNRGQLAEALQALDRVGANSPNHLAADELRIDIQQLLLAGGPDRSTAKVDRR